LLQNPGGATAFSDGRRSAAFFGSNCRRAGAYRLAAPGAIPYFDFEVMELEHNKALAEQSRAGKHGRLVLQLSADV